MTSVKLLGVMTLPGFVELNPPVEPPFNPCSNYTPPPANAANINVCRQIVGSDPGPQTTACSDYMPPAANAANINVCREII